MRRLVEVPVTARSLEGLGPVSVTTQTDDLWPVLDQLRARLRGRVLWNVSLTSAGGGSAELIRSFVSYARGAGINARWMTIQGPPEFFAVTTELHRALHGEGEGEPALDSEARALYEQVLHENGLELTALVRRDDLVILHDSHTAGLILSAVDAGARVVWRCHHGADRPNEHTERAWRFLAPYVGAAHACAFTRKALVPSVCDLRRTEIIPPALDPLSPKNQDLAPETVRAILVHAGILEGPAGPGSREFIREDGTLTRVDRCADVIRLGRAPSPETSLVVQVSRWDRLKDPVGLLTGFAVVSEGFGPIDAALVLAGPDPRAIDADPEGPVVLNEVIQAWVGLPYAERRRIHLVNLPMVDREENAAMVNALQRHATVVVQKSACAGFGLSVTEAMWKGRPVVGSAVGGIAGQIEDGESGLLIHDRTDVAAFGRALRRILTDPDLAARLGQAARERALQQAFGAGPIERWHALLGRLDAEADEGNGTR